MASKDPYVYFRVEARELLDGLQRGVLELEKGAADKETISRLLRQAHTLKGAARVVKQSAVADFAHTIEERLAPLRAGGSAERASVDELLRILDGISAALKALDGDPAPAPEQRRVPVESSLDTVRVEIGEMDALLQGVAETAVQLTSLKQREAQAEHCRALGARLLQQLQGQPSVRAIADELSGELEKLRRGWKGGVEQAERELAQVRDTADRLRLVPARALFAMLERAIRDAARSLDRRVELSVAGGENRVDGPVLSKLGEALLHLVRNAVAHGIESEPDRKKVGKPSFGTIEISFERRGSRLACVCRDDGRGIDVEAVRAVAVRRRLVSPTEARTLDLDKAVALLLRGGVSTTEVVDQTSGRGIGLDVVRAVAAELKGDVAVRSTSGQGTTFELTVPASLSSVHALAVESSGVTAAIPVAAVAGIVRCDSSAISRSERRESMVHEGKAIPFLSLGHAIHPHGRNGQARHTSVIVVRSEATLTAIGVERLLGTSELVVRPLPATLPADAMVAGAWFDAEGNPCLLLDPDGLARVARIDRAVASEKPAPRPLVLVVDDSLTTRMLEQSILESAGYEVDLATSAEEGLEKAHARRHRLFLVDVEMPGMDGFEFVSRTRADPVLRDTPAMLVTSRAATEDKRRGEQVGARAYIVKSEFDQGRLLQTIRGLIG